MLLTVFPDLGIPPLFQVVGAVALAVALMDNPEVGAVQTVGLRITRQQLELRANQRILVDHVLVVVVDQRGSTCVSLEALEAVVAVGALALLVILVVMEIPEVQAIPARQQTPQRLTVLA